MKMENKTKKVLVIIDMQNDFIDGTLGTKEAVAIVPKVEEKIRNFKRWQIQNMKDSATELTTTNSNTKAYRSCKNSTTISII